MCAGKTSNTALQFIGRGFYPWKCVFADTSHCQLFLQDIDKDWVRETEQGPVET